MCVNIFFIPLTKKGKPFFPCPKLFWLGRMRVVVLDMPLKTSGTPSIGGIVTTNTVINQPFLNCETRTNNILTLKLRELSGYNKSAQDFE